MEALVKRIYREYSLFYLDMMRSSRENLFSKSREIEMKKRISSVLQKKCKELSEQEIGKIDRYDHILDSVFRLACDYEYVNSMNAEFIVDEWFRLFLEVKI